MTPIVLDRPRSTVTRASRPAVTVGAPAPRADGSDPLVLRAESPTDLTLGAARADVLRLGFSSAIPSVAEMSRLVALLEREIAAFGRDRAGVRIALDVEVVLADDDGDARRRRTHLDHLDALAGISWSAAATRVVGVPGEVVAAALRLAERVGADEVVLVPLSGRAGADRLRDLVRRGAATG